TGLWFYENGVWYFYVFSPAVESEGWRKAIRRFRTILQEMPELAWIDPMEVKLFSTDSPFGEDILDLQRHTPKLGRMSMEIRQLGGMNLEGAYFYPLTAVPR